MQLLLDTHIFIWWLNDDLQLTKHARSLITDAQYVYVSSASIWEIVIKVQLKKLQLDVEKLMESFNSQGFLELPITMRHAAFVFQLPFHHRDPFDRILIAQAMSEPLRLVTADKGLKNYSQLIELI